MLRLKKLVIHRYRSVPPGTTLEFADGVNAILGQNGSGKTTLLNLIVMILRGDFSPLKDEPEEAPAPNPLLPKRERLGRIVEVQEADPTKVVGGVVPASLGAGLPLPLQVPSTLPTPSPYLCSLSDPPGPLSGRCPCPWPRWSRPPWCPTPRQPTSTPPPAWRWRPPRRTRTAPRPPPPRPRRPPRRPRRRRLRPRRRPRRLPPPPRPPKLPWWAP